MTDWTRPVEVMERGELLATITRDGDRYTVTGSTGRVDTFKDAGIMRNWLAWAYPEADTLKQGGEVLEGR